jgi:AcrR family transcriptional regulator
VPGDRRQTLIDIARGMFATQSYDQVTTSEIAKRAGVAYGLIAHHFENKRGLYLAVMNEIAGEIAAIQLTPPAGDADPIERLRHALRNHIDYIDGHATSFVALVRGQLGAEPEQQRAVDDLRWRGAERVLDAIGLPGPPTPTLRTAMRGWVGGLDEMMIDRILHGDPDAEALVELAVTALVATLRTVRRLDGSIVVAPQVVEALEGFPG